MATSVLAAGSPSQQGRSGGAVSISSGAVPAPAWESTGASQALTQDWANVPREQKNTPGKAGVEVLGRNDMSAGLPTRNGEISAVLIHSKRVPARP